MKNDCPHCSKSLSRLISLRLRWRRNFLLLPIPHPVFVCSSCGGRLYANPHPVAQYLNAALWITLAITQYGIFSGASLVLVGVAAILFFLFAAACRYVSTHTLRDWPTFRAAPQR